MKITDKQIKELREYLPEIDRIVETDDLQELEIQLDGLIADIGLTDDQEWLNPTGKKLQKIYDEIYAQNHN